jgi:hypothetical protein
MEPKTVAKAAAIESWKHQCIKMHHPNSLIYIYTHTVSHQACQLQCKAKSSKSKKGNAILGGKEEWEEAITECKEGCNEEKATIESWKY